MNRWEPIDFTLFMEECLDEFKDRTCSWHSSRREFIGYMQELLKIAGDKLDPPEKPSC